MRRCFVLDLSGEKITWSLSLVGHLKESVCEPKLLRPLLRLCFSAPHVFSGFCRESSCTLSCFSVLGQDFLCLYFAQEKMVNFLPGQRSMSSVFSNIPRRFVLS